MSSGYEPNPVIMKSHKTIIKKLEEYLDKFEAEIKKLIYSDDWLTSKVDKILTNKGAD